MAGRPIDAMALVALGFRSVSMAPAAVGPVKAMLLSLDISDAARELERLIDRGEKDIRHSLVRFAEKAGVDH